MTDSAITTHPLINSTGINSILTKYWLHSQATYHQKTNS